MSKLLPFYEIIFRGTPIDYCTTVVTFDKKSGPPKLIKPFKMSQLDDMATFCLALAKEQPTVDVYYRPSSMSHMPQRGRGTETDTTGSAVLYIDIDNYKVGRPMGEVVAALEAFSMPPSAIVHSGGGIQVYWRLHTYCTDIPAMKNRIRWLAHQFVEFGSDMGTVELARVLRVPETFNLKEETPRLAQVVRLDASREYTLDSFGVLGASGVILDLPSVDEEAIPDDFLATIQRTAPHIYKRIWSEESAREVQPQWELDAFGKVDRSRNDVTISLMLLSHGYSPGVVMSVLKHPLWFSGAKYRENSDHKYVESTVLFALQRVERDPDKYFDKNTFVPVKMVEAIQRSNHFLLVGGSLLWYFKDGAWRQGGERYLQQEVATRLGTKWKSHYGDEVVKWFTHNAPLLDLLIPQRRLTIDELSINTLSGILNLGTGELVPHTHTYQGLNQIPVHYDPYAKGEVVDTFVRQILSPDAVDCFWEYVGYCLLTSDVRFRKSMLIIGEKWTGKSTLLELLQRFFGVHNTTAKSLQELCDTRFGAADLVTKVANVYSDLDTAALKDSGKWKIYVSGDRVQVEAKFKNPFFASLTAKHMFSANDFPAVVDPDEAFFDRWLVMRTMRMFMPSSAESEGDADLLLIERLSTPQQLSGVLNLAIAGLRRLLEQEYFSEGVSMREAHAQFQASVDAVYAFVLQETEEPADSWQEAYITKADLFSRYRMWGTDVGRGSYMSQAKFFRRVAGMAPRFGLTQGSKVIDGVQVQVYRGRRMRPLISPSETGAVVRTGMDYS